MCKYRENNNCKATGNICPWAQWCGKLSVWKERAGSEKYCKYRKSEPTPDGYYKVEFEKRGFLYINFQNEVIKVPNPFNDIPKFVKVKQLKNSYKLSR